MSAQSIHDLLPIPKGTVEPHPYQVLGLEIGTQDPKAIFHAVQFTVSRLKEVKSTTDPKVWKKAAHLVKQAHETLSDPAKKADLDARFGIVSLSSSSAPPRRSRSINPPLEDPLAGLLPEGDPFAPPPERRPTAHAPSEQASASLRDSMRPIAPPPASPLQEQCNREFVPTTTPWLMEVQPAPIKSPQPRRRRSIAGPLAFSAFVLASLGIIGTLVTLLIVKSGQHTLLNADGPVSIATPSPAAGDTVVVSRPRSIESSNPVTTRDPIMGNLGRRNSVPSTRRQPSGLTAGLTNSPPTPTASEENLSNMPVMDLSMSNPTTSEPAMPELSSTELNPEMSLPMEPSATTMAPAPAPAMEPPSEEAIVQAEQTLQQVRDTIRRADWKRMKGAAEAALDKPMSDDQKAAAQALFELADLANYYRGGIEKAVAELKVGNDFEVSDNFRVIVVETGEDKLVVRFDAKNRSFTLNELPWPLAHKLATFSIPESPTSEAAKAVYQAIAPKSSDAHREQALQWLDDTQGEVEGADPTSLSETIRSLFAES